MAGATARPVTMQAAPVWPSTLLDEMHAFVGVRTSLPRIDGPSMLRIAAASLYRVFLDGRFVGHGPARAAHGHARIDEWVLPAIAQGAVLAIEIAGYGINSYYLIKQPPFVQAEVVAEGRVVAATAPGDVAWQAASLPHRRLRVQRYSWMRAFLEAYDLNPRSHAWRTGKPFAAVPLPLDAAPTRTLLGRRTPQPAFDVIAPASISASGTATPCPLPAEPWRDRSLTQIGPQCLGWREDELEVLPSLDLQRLSFAIDAAPREHILPARIEAGRFLVLDFGINLSGFIGARMEAMEDSRVHLIFDEVAMANGDVDFKRWSSANIVLLDLAAGTHEFESIEPYTLRFLKVFVERGSMRLDEAHLRELANPAAHVRTLCTGNTAVDALFEAGRQTFRQNAVDLFMDCPGRERGGYLCDSFFAARAAFVLTGNTDVEHDFLENYLLAPDPFPNLPDGMLPMCYPADHFDGLHIPNWAMWLVLQLKEYASRGGDMALVRAFEPKVAKLVDIFARHENEHGLLEDLPGWVFVEWSAANDYMAGVNFPTNMLYAAFLHDAGRLFARQELVAKSAALRATIRDLSFDGTFFVDQALRRDGRFVRTENRSEVCQYYASFFSIAQGAPFAAFHESLARDFGPHREADRVHPGVKRANAFIGNVLRLDILSASGRRQQAVEEALAYYGNQAATTGTLWEFDTTFASCNHGFGAHVCHLLLRDGAGVRLVNMARRVAALEVPLPLMGAGKMELPVGGEWLHSQWDANGNHDNVMPPSGWKVGTLA